jgi:hypothetical protein
MIKAKELAAIRAGELSADTLLEMYPVKSLVADLVEVIKSSGSNDYAKQISVSKDEYEKIISMFRIKGFEANGQPTKRGRKKKATAAAE